MLNSSRRASFAALVGARRAAELFTRSVPLPASRRVWSKWPLKLVIPGAVPPSSFVVRSEPDHESLMSDVSTFLPFAVERVDATPWAPSVMKS